MQLTGNERYYRQVLTALGCGLLFFLLFLGLISVAVSGSAVLLEFLPISETAAKVVYQLVYGALYLAAFMCPVPIMRGLMKAKKLPWQPMRSDVRVSRYLPLIVLGGIALIWSQAFLNSAMVSFFSYDDLFDSMLPVTDSETGALDTVLSFLVMALVPAFCEEFLFRGAILTNLLPFGRGTAILVSALAFSLMHQNIGQILYAFGAGILLGWIYEKTGSIWNCVILHLMNNFFSVIETVLDERLGAWTDGAATLIFEAVFSVLGVVATVVLVRKVSEKDSFRDGAFGRSLPVSDDYAACPLAPNRAVRLLIGSPMGIFLIACALAALAMLGMLLLGGLLV